MKKRQNNKQKKTKPLIPLLKFLGKFILVIALYYTFVLIANESLFNTYLNITAEISSLLLNILGQHTTTSASMISSQTTVVMLSFGCEGTEPIIIFLAGIIAIPIKFNFKLIPALIGIVSLYILNFIRIVVLFFIQKNQPDLFESFHSIIFPIFFILLSLICLGLCLQWALKKSKAS